MVLLRMHAFCWRYLKEIFRISTLVYTSVAVDIYNYGRHTTFGSLLLMQKQQTEL